MKIVSDNRILIVGLGLIGGSYAQALTSLGYEVYALTRTPSTITYAKENGMIKDGMTEIDPAFISSFDFVIFSLYPNALFDWMKKYHSYLKKGALISDVTGVKKSIVYPIQELLKEDDIDFVASHPMAGKEVYGVKNADKEIFKKANFIVTPTENNKEENVKRIEELGKILGFKNISRLSVEQHDKMIAFLSQLTHIIAVSLMNCPDSLDYQKYTGDSFRDLTRIANINENMWSELFLLNKEELLKSIDNFSSQLDRMKEYIQNDDIEGMKEMMKTSSSRRKEL